MTEADATEPAPGFYRHFKGGRYELLGVARHSETGERLVVYRPCYGEGGLWVRPLAMWSEAVEGPDGRVPRFRPEATR
jgi:hypothetical protein